ncbi:hypothetical protein H5P28_17805 [Ruficoccus amylovorans]|uniref:Uncharacterized protein n=1 Tax=Ruficoccus amylovorans TaxID=1804625 RepID=A0A842HKY8_9BACT|nr:hypothetical protein [Ruficoccus amylovorans]MBC2596127.1 hypothetical protein [Ruficoccus amylovorans]
MKKIYIFVVTCTLSIVSYGNTVGLPEGTAANQLSMFISIYQRWENGKLPSSWNDIAQVDEGLTSLNSSFSDGASIDKLYSFILPEDRQKYPEGELLLIRSRPMEWPEAWESGVQVEDRSKLTDEQRKEWERLQEVKKGYQRPIRYLIYKDKNGEYIADWWYEDDVQKMLEKTGIRVPPPIPYHQDQHVEETVFPDQVAPVSQTVETHEKDAVPHEAPANFAKPQHEQEPTTTRWWSWALSAIILILALIALIRKRKS